MKKFLLFVGILFASFSAKSQQFFVCAQEGIVINSPLFVYNPLTQSFIITAVVDVGNNGKQSAYVIVMCGSNPTPVLEVCLELGANEILLTTQATVTTCLPTDLRVYIAITQGDCSTGKSQEFAEYTRDNGVCPPGLLPVTLKSFVAKKNGNAAGLTWQTSVETNFKEFIIQKKTTGDYVDVATIAGKNSVNGSTYSYNDNNLGKGVSLYRLKIVDLDGTVSYSETRVVRGEGAVGFHIYPNPSRGNAKITINDSGDPIDVIVSDNTGRVVRKISVNGTNQVELNNLHSGLYLVRLINKTTGESTTQKLTVTN